MPRVVGDVVRDALTHLKIVAASEDPAPEDMAAGLRALNLMMARWEADGLALGWTGATNPADELTIPAEVEEVVGHHLALRLRARYGLPVDMDVVALAEAGMAALKADVLSREYARVSYDMLPRTRGGDFFEG